MLGADLVQITYHNMEIMAIIETYRVASVYLEVALTVLTSCSQAFNPKAL
jgi:hypothetical protein